MRADPQGVCARLLQTHYRRREIRPTGLGKLQAQVDGRMEHLPNAP